MASNTEFVDELSDDEIRQKLEELGSPVVPVTRNTRRVLILKLKQLLRQQNNHDTCKGKHSQCICCDSEEESNGKEQSLPRPATPSRRSKRASSLSCLSTKTPSKSSINSKSSNSNKKNHSRKIAFSPITTVRNLPTDTESDIDVVSYDEKDTHHLTSLKPGRNDYFPIDSRNKDIDSDMYDNIKTFLGCISGLRVKHWFGQNNANFKGKTGNVSVPHSDFLTERNHNSYKSRKVCQGRSRRLTSLWTLIISVYITILTTIFLLFTYYKLKGYYPYKWKPATIDSDGNVYPICGLENVDPTICIEKYYLAPALDVANIIIPHLINVTISSHCDQHFIEKTKEAPILTDEDALKYLLIQLPNKSALYLQEDLKNFKILVIYNTHWNIQLVPDEIKDITNVSLYGHLSTKVFNIPFICQLRHVAHHIPNINILGLVSGICILLVAEYVKRQREIHQKKVYKLVDDLLLVLASRQNNKSKQAFLSINQCKQMVIHPEDFCKREREWEDAVRFIEEHESRVRNEIRCINGHYENVWLWAPTRDDSFHSKHQ